MLIVALGWSLLEAILKNKTEHIGENGHHREICDQKHSSIMYIHTTGGHSISRKNNIIWAVISVLEGQRPLEWQCQTIVFRKISEVHLEPCSSLCTVVESLHEGGDFLFSLTGSVTYDASAWRVGR